MLHCYLEPCRSAASIGREHSSESISVPSGIERSLIRMVGTELIS